jgi:hypothetical protein
VNLPETIVPFRAIGLCLLLLPWYIGTMMTKGDSFVIERVQTGVRMEKRLLKVLKAFAEYHDLTLGDLLEGIVLHAFDGKAPFSQESLNRIKELKKFYGLELDSSASHRLRESMHSESSRKRDAKTRLS